MASRATNLSITSVGAAALLLAGAALWFGVGSPDPPPTTIAATGADHLARGEAPVPGPKLTVHVSGAVAVPGVVDAPDGARVADVVLLAGGATSDADLTRLNLASTVRDGEHIVVPTLDEMSPSVATEQFDINTADAVAFDGLPGIGPVLAERIVAYRDEHGPFGVLEDLLDVPGIGESKLAVVRDALENG
jgi:competence protein ComEA